MRKRIAADMMRLLEQVQHGSGDSCKHVLTLFSLAMSLGARRIIELGVREGATTLPLLMAAALNDGELVSVDAEPVSFDPPAEYRPHWRCVRQDAVSFLAEYDKSKIVDLVYLDDWHAYRHVSQELAYLDEAVSPRSVILVHDLMYGGHEPHYHSDLTLTHGQWAEGGPYRAVAELPTNFWEFSTIPVCNGLTILRKKYSSRYHS